jgi:hypothetical protein
MKEEQSKIVKIVSVIGGSIILIYLSWWGINAISSLTNVVSTQDNVDTLKQMRHYHPEQLK